MFPKTSIKHSPQQLPTSPSLQNIVVDLDPQHEESISAGGHLPVILIFGSHSNQLLARSSKPKEIVVVGSKLTQ